MEIKVACLYFLRRVESATADVVVTDLERMDPLFNQRTDYTLVFFSAAVAVYVVEVGREQRAAVVEDLVFLNISNDTTFHEQTS